MKRFLSLITLVIFTMTSCSSDDGMGTRGPPGPPGEPGADGLIGTVFDVEGDFTADNDYTLFAEYADFTSAEVFESDVVLVYLRVGEDGTADGEPVYVWRLLPQTYYVDGGTVQYNYDYTFFDVNIFLDSNVDLGSLGAAFTDNQVFRVAIVPAAFASNPNVNVADYKSVMKALDFQEQDIPDLEVLN